MARKYDGSIGGKVKHLLWVAVVAGSLASCSTETKKEVGFLASIQPVLNEKCLQCHFGDRASFNMTRDDSYPVLKKYIVAGKAESSPLYIKVKNGHATVAPMTSAELESLKEWIDQGAMRN